MYRVLLLPRKCLITSDEVIKQGPTDNNVDVRQIISAIQIAEDRFIKPILGNDFYDLIRNAKNVVVTEINKAYLQDEINDSLPEGSEQVQLKADEIVNAIEFVEDEWIVSLWNEYLWKICAECVVYVATPTNWSRFTASGEMMNNPKSVAMAGDGKSAASVDIEDIKWKLNKMLFDRISPLISQMKQWICLHKEHYPLFKDCQKCNEKTSPGRKSGWVGGIYDN